LATEKKIAVVHSVLRWLAQTEAWLYTQVREVPSRIESHVVCEAKSNLDQFEVPNIHCLRDRPSWASVVDRGLRRAHFRNHLNYLVERSRSVGASVIHSHYGDRGWRDMGAVRKAGAKHIVTFYGSDLTYLPRANPVWSDRYRYMFEHIDQVLCEGEHMARCVVDLGCGEDRVTVHHLGIDVERIPFEPRRREAGEPLKVLIASSFREKKGIPYALEALGRVSADVDLEVTMIGDALPTDTRGQSEKTKILDAIRRHGLEPKIRMLGYQTYAELITVARRHHVFLSPSVTASDGDTEGGAPVSIIDMSASGMMVISTTHCDIPGVILDQESGLLAAERDVDGLVERLHWVNANPGRWRDMQQAGRRHIESEFDSRVQGERLAAIYEGVSGR